MRLGAPPPAALQSIHLRLSLGRGLRNKYVAVTREGNNKKHFSIHRLRAEDIRRYEYQTCYLLRPSSPPHMSSSLKLYSIMAESFQQKIKYLSRKVKLFFQIKCED